MKIIKNNQTHLLKMLFAVSFVFVAPSALGLVWVNEIHYDNAGPDVDEMIEVFVEDSFAGNLDEIVVYLYNGGDRELYDSNSDFSVGSDFTAGSTIPGRGVFYSLILPQNGLQNGGPDGIALVNGGTVVQFLSYEGAFVASGGPADGMESVDIGVSESGGSPVGGSLGLSGTGSTSDEFTWSVLTNSTPGAPNTGQFFGSFVAPVSELSAVATSTSAIEVSVVGNGSDDVLVVSNLTGAFTAPVNGDPVPAVGQPYLGGTVEFFGGSGTFIDTELDEGVDVYYTAFSVSVANGYSTPTSVSATPGRLTVDAEEFEGESGWTNVVVRGTGAGWDLSGGDAFANAFNDSDDELYYLISPEYDFSMARDLLFSFSYEEAWNGPNMEVVYSTDYDGVSDPESTASWSSFEISLSDVSSNGTRNTDAVDDFPVSVLLEGVSSAHFAFRYRKSPDLEGGNAELWQVDNILLTKSVTPLGIVPEPTNHPTSFVGEAISFDEVRVSWVDSEGGQEPLAYLIVVGNEQPLPEPSDGVPQGNDTDLSDGSGFLNVLQGVQEASFSDLPSSTTFYFEIFPYTNSGGSIDYKTEGELAAVVTTQESAPEPSFHVSDLQVVAEGQNIQIAWTDPSVGSLPENYLVLVSTVESPVLPADGFDPVLDSNLNDRIALLKVPFGEELASIIGIPDTTYYVHVIPYSNDGINIDFKLDGTIPVQSATTGTLPNLIITEFLANPDLAADANGEWFEIFNAGFHAVDLEGFRVMDDDSNSHQIVGSLVVPAGNFVVLGISDDAVANGGVDIDYVYTGFQLANGEDEIVLMSPDGITEVDRIVYSSATFPIVAGASAIFTGDAMDDNNSASNWQSATVRDARFDVNPDGDLGSPGTNGTGQSLPVVVGPTDVSADSISSTEVEILFTLPEGLDVLIVYNDTGSFGSPSGPPPGVGLPFAGGTVLSIGDSSPLVHSGLVPGQTIHYEVFSKSPLNVYSAGVSVSATPGLVASEDFQNGATWVNETVTGGRPWNTSGDRAEIDGFNNGIEPEIHYLVSPPLDFSGRGTLAMAFAYGEAFDGPNLQLLYSTNYSGSGNPEADGVEWESVHFDFEDISTNEVFSNFSSGIIPLPVELEDKAGTYLAFKYVADGSATGSEEWYVDDILITFGSSSVVPDPVADYLADFDLTEADLGSDAGDNDGLPVLLEYVIDGDPNVPDSLRLRGLAFEEGGESPRLTLEFVSNRPDEPDGVTIEVLGSNDLGSTDPFVPVGFEFLAPIDNGDGTFTHRYRQIAPIGDASAKAFIRLRVTRDVP